MSTSTVRVTDQARSVERRRREMPSAPARVGQRDQPEPPPHRLEQVDRVVELRGVGRGDDGEPEVVGQQVQDLAGEPVLERGRDARLRLTQRELHRLPVHQLGVRRGHGGRGERPERVAGEQPLHAGGDQRADAVLDRGPELLQPGRQDRQGVVDGGLDVRVGHHRVGDLLVDPGLDLGQIDDGLDVRHEDLGVDHVVPGPQRMARGEQADRADQDQQARGEATHGVPLRVGRAAAAAPRSPEEGGTPSPSRDEVRVSDRRDRHRTPAHASDPLSSRARRRRAHGSGARSNSAATTVADTMIRAVASSQPISESVTPNRPYRLL